MLRFVWKVCKTTLYVKMCHHHKQYFVVFGSESELFMAIYWTDTS